MIIAKFGGTSVADAAAIKRLVSIIASRREDRPVVVVSALARMTDALLDLEHAGATIDNRLTTILERHQTVAAELALPPAVIGRIEEDVSALRQWLLVRAGSHWRPFESDHVVSHGELWSSRLVTAALEAAGVPSRWVDARHVVVTDARFTKAAPQLDEIRRRARQIIPPLTEAGTVPVTQGFIGATADGQTTTLGRGGSDYTASLLGAALDAQRVEIWTDVDGILSADPRIVPDAHLLAEASYHEAAELAAFGAKVLHPATQSPLVDAGIPCWVLNSFAPDRPGTRIVAGARPTFVGNSPVRSIAWKRGITIINVRAPRRLGAVEFLQQLFGVFANHGVAVDVLASSEVNVSVTIDGSTERTGLLRDLQALGTVTVLDGRAIVAVIGVDLRGSRGLSARLFHAVRDVNIEVISQGASEINVTFVVREEDGPAAVKALHQEFFSAA
ncbi:MAG: lysine-sensitive aspartokinase 3 [Gemmatimonadales bacterium]|nr:lysine-sensitive aspartokinase 3 [Gemmatimonadales bacterium]